MMAYDPASIPDVTALYHAITWNIAFILGAALFVFSIVDEASKPLRDQKPAYGKVIFRSLTIMAGMLLYRTIFLAIVATCQVISYSIFSMDDWGQVQAVFKNFASSGGIWSWTVETLVGEVVKYLAVAVEEIFMRARYIFLALLYVIGPFAFVMGFWPSTNKFIKGWFKNLLEFSFWIITLRVVQSVFASLNMASITAGVVIDPVDYIIFGILYIVLVIGTPFITAKFLSGESMGQFGSMAVGAVSMVAAKVASSKIARNAGGRVSGAFSSAGSYAAGRISRIPGVRKIAESAGNLNSALEKPRKARTAPKVKSGDE
ncbi:MAG: hypothetical protein U0944_00325 [Candidatus Moranbacteria bacterium]|nr:hypothetical protein [Candidatus Moranbacteria bacterium]